MTAARPLARGDVVLVSFPFTDQRGQSVRPALVVAQPKGSDVLLAFVTTRLETSDPEADYLLDPGNPEFAATGLKMPSRVRLRRLATIERRFVRRRIGRIGPATEAGIAHCLRHVFEL